MVAKGHDFPGITLVGVIEADLGLHLPDFRAGERTFQLLSQVAGRAGRGLDPGRVVVQTFSPEHYTLLLAQQHDYESFFIRELEERRQAGYPPFSRLALCLFQGNSRAATWEAAWEAAERGREMLGARPEADIDLVGPAPAPRSRIKNKHRFQVLLHCPRIKLLHQFLSPWLAETRRVLPGGVSLAVDVDPYSMM
jgi:primosomal protein N' (replication factor Y)